MSNRVELTCALNPEIVNFVLAGLKLFFACMAIT